MHTERHEPASPIDAFIAQGPTVLVFLPNTNEVQRFVLTDAFSQIGERHRLHYVLPASEADAIRAAVAPLFTAENSCTLHVPPDRFKVWQRVFEAGCEEYASLSPSFAIRAHLPVDATWREHRKVSNEARAALDARFDARVSRLLEGLEPLPEILALFDRYRPIYCVVPTSLLDLFCNDVTWACKKAGVACLLLQSGWDNMSSKGIITFRSAFVGVWGPQSRAHAKLIQRVPSGYVACLGAPHYKFLRPAEPAVVAVTRSRLGVQPDERLLLFGGSFRQFDEITTLAAMEAAIEGDRLPRLRVIYRPHPWRAARQYEENFFARTWRHVVFDPDMTDRYEREQREAGYIKRNTPMFDMAYLSTLISASDAVVSPMSTLLLEALILGKPTMAIAFGDRKHAHNPSVTAQMTHFEGLQGNDAVTWCDTEELLVRDLERLLKPKRAPRSASLRERLLQEIVTTEPGSYAARLSEFSRTVVEPRGRKLRAHYTAQQRDTISHAYGAHLIARDYCGIDRARAAMVPGYWMHGWIPSYHNIHYALIALHKKKGQHGDWDFEAQIQQEKFDTIQWVSRADQAEFLLANGYQHVRAIGLPITYLPDPGVRREAGSLLVLPPHSHKTHGPDDPLAEEYAEQIAALKPQFSRIVVGLNEDDIAKAQWIESFRRRGISVFTTTDQADPLTLMRLQRILSTFEYVTTNGYGSHIVLAAYCGAKVSVYGPYAEFPYERMKVTHAVKMFPRLLDSAYALCTEEAVRRHYPFLFVEPGQAVELREWAAQEVGEPSRVSPKELARLFGWEGLTGGASLPSPSRPRGRAVPRTPLVPGQPPRRPRVLFAMAHQGFVRNFERVVIGMLTAGVDVHLHFSKLHDSLSLDDFNLVEPDQIGRLTASHGEGRRVKPNVARNRVMRDLLLYSRPAYESAVDLRERLEKHSKGELSHEEYERLSRRIHRLPERVKDCLDSWLACREMAIAPSPDAEAVLDTVRPDYVIVTPLVNFNSREVDIVKAARRRRIRTLNPVASWDNLTNKGRLKVKPDVMVVWNESMAMEAITLHRMPREQILVTGAPLFDDWFTRRPSQTRTDFLAARGLKPDRPLLVYLCSSASITGNQETSIVKLWLKGLQEVVGVDVNLMIRPHPMAAGWEKLVGPNPSEVASSRAAVIWPLRPSHPITEASRAAFFDTLFHADAVVGLNTSAMVEAAILRKPVFTFFGHSQTQAQTGNLHFKYLRDSGFVFHDPSLGAHLERIRAFLEGWSDRERLGHADACDRFVNTFARPLGRDVDVAPVLVQKIIEDMNLEFAPSVETKEAARITR